MLAAVLIRTGTAERVRGSRGNLGGKANIIIDEKTKHTIKGFLASFTPIDLHRRVGERAFRGPGGAIH